MENIHVRKEYYFDIIDNYGKPYTSTIVMLPYTWLTKQNIIDKIISVYRLKSEEQVISLEPTDRVFEW